MPTQLSDLTYPNMPFATVLRVVVIVILLNRHISKVDVRVGDVISIICVSRVAKSRKTMSVSVINVFD